MPNKACKLIDRVFYFGICMNKYYHITNADIKILNSILINGLMGDDEGNIFLFEDKSITINGIRNNISDCIAHNQLFLSEYYLLEINSKGIKGELLQDNVAEFSAQWQWIVKQKKIWPSYIKVCGRVKTIYKPFY